MRQVVLDTETTGLSAERGHRLVEIGCLELIERRKTGRHFQRYLNPQRAMDQGASEVTGLTDDFLQDKPLFADVVDAFLDFVRGAEVIIHNAAFDVSFVDAELARLGRPERLRQIANVIDSLEMARERFPGQRNSLDALCKRLGVDNGHRTLHGALLDAELLADVYLEMTSGQGDLGLAAPVAAEQRIQHEQQAVDRLTGFKVRLLKASPAEREAHALRLQALRKSGKCLWPEETERFSAGTSVA